MTPRPLLTTDEETGFGRHFGQTGQRGQPERCLRWRAMAWDLLRACMLSVFFLLLAVGSHGYAEVAQPNPSSPGTTGSDANAIPAQIAAYSQDLERLRRFMGAPRAGKFNIGIHSNLTRDLYFQTLTLWQKTDRLLFEISRVRATPPPTSGARNRTTSPPPLGWIATSSARSSIGPMSQDYQDVRFQGVVASRWLRDCKARSATSKSLSELDQYSGKGAV